MFSQLSQMKINNKLVSIAWEVSRWMHSLSFGNLRFYLVFIRFIFKALHVGWILQSCQKRVKIRESDPSPIHALFYRYCRWNWEDPMKAVSGYNVGRWELSDWQCWLPGLYIWDVAWSLKWRRFLSLHSKLFPRVFRDHFSLFSRAKIGASAKREKKG